MKQKHQQIANLVIGYASYLGIDLLSYTNDEDTPFTEEYLTNYLDAAIDVSPDKIPSIYLYIEVDSQIALLIDEETWNNNPAEDQDEYKVYTIQFWECNVHFEINQ